MNATQLNEHNPLELFNSCVRLAYKIAGDIQRTNPRVEPEDMDQVALLALWQAALRYDSNSGNKFSTLATHYIHGKCMTYLRDLADLVKKPASCFWEMPLQKRVVPSKKVEEEHDHNFFLDVLTADRSATPLEILLEAEELKIEIWELEESLGFLSWEQQYCLERHVLFGDTYLEIGKKLGIHKDKVGELVRSAAKDLTGRGGLLSFAQKRHRSAGLMPMQYEPIEKLKYKKSKVSGVKSKPKKEKPLKIKVEKPKKEKPLKVKAEKSKKGYQRKPRGQWKKGKVTQEIHKNILMLKDNGYSLCEIRTKMGLAYDTVWHWAKKPLAYWDDL